MGLTSLHELQAGLHLSKLFLNSEGPSSQAEERVEPGLLPTFGHDSLLSGNSHEQDSPVKFRFKILHEVKHFNFIS